jgi:hypothetical protein
MAESERSGALKNSRRSLASKFEPPQEMRVWPGSRRFFPTKILLPNFSWKHGRREKHWALSAEKYHQAGLKKAKLSLDSKVVWSQQVDLPDKQKKSSGQSKCRHVRIKPLNFEAR